MRTVRGQIGQHYQSVREYALVCVHAINYKNEDSRSALCFAQRVAIENSEEINHHNRYMHYDRHSLMSYSWMAPASYPLSMSLASLIAALSPSSTT